MEFEFVEPPEEFEELVRDALLHLYDPAHLQTHTLVGLASLTGSSPIANSKLLRQALLDGIEDLQPVAGETAASRSWRSYRILELRYIEGRDVTEVGEEVALSKSQYHREHRRALQAVSSLLWKNWQVASRWSGYAGSSQTRVERPLALPPSGDGASAPSPSEASGRIEPAEVMSGVCTLLRPLCELRGTTLRLDLPTELPIIQGDRVALRQALLAVLTHAIRVVESGAVEVVGEYEDGRLRIRIEGRSSALLEPRELGVEESRRFTEALRGSLSCFKSDEATGHWVVHLDFPVSGRATLLVVDNERDFIGLIERYLVGYEWEVIGVSDVDQAFAVARERRPSGILLDVVIPNRDGWDLLLQLKTTPATQGIPVVICSVLDEPEVATSLGAARYLQKPVDQRQLLETLNGLR